MRLKLRALRGDEAQHDRFGPGHEPQWRETARPLIVVLEKIAVDVHLVEQDLRDWFVTPFGEPRASEIAATEVNANHEIFWAIAECSVDEGRIGSGQFVGIVAAIHGALAHLGVTQIGEIGVVHLDVPAAGGVERGDLIAIALRKIVEEEVEVRIRLDVDSGASAAKVHHGWRGNGHLGRSRRVSLQEIEVIDLDVAGVTEFSGDTEAWWGEVDGLAGIRTGLDGAVDGHAVEAFEEVEMEIGAPDFSIGDGAQPNVFLHAHDARDFFILDRPEFAP